MIAKTRYILNKYLGTYLSNIATYGTSPWALAMSRSGRYVYVSDSASALITVVDTYTASKQQIVTNGGSLGLALTPDETLLFSCINNGADADKVRRIPLPTGSQTSIAVGTNPRGMAMTPNGIYLFVANQGSNNVTRITVADSSTTPIAAGNAPMNPAPSPDGKLIYVPNNTDDTVTRIVVATSATSTIPVGAAPTAVAFSPNGVFAYVTCPDDGAITRIEVATSATSTISCGMSTSPYGVAISADSTLAYATDADGTEMLRIDTGSGVVSSIPGSAAGNFVLFSPLESRAYASLFGAGGELAVVDNLAAAA